MPESFRTRFERLAFNLYPCYRGTGASLTFIASDWHEGKLVLPPSRRTRNYRGSIYGGSIYAAVDPIFMLMLIKNLGASYNIWDKSASIRFIKPGRLALYARFEIDEAELVGIRKELQQKYALDRVYKVDFTDEYGIPNASVEKTIFIANQVPRQ